MKYFFVMQNKTFRQEYEGGFLWAPYRTVNNRRNALWELMEEVEYGDVIIHSFHQKIVAVSIATSGCYQGQRPKEGFDDWEQEGRRVDVEYHLFQQKITTSDHMAQLQSFQPEKNAPFHKGGRGNTGYLFAATKEMYEYIIIETARLQQDKLDRQAVLELLNPISQKQIQQINDTYGERLKNDLNVIKFVPKMDFKYERQPRDKKELKIVAGVEVQSRDRQIAFNALMYSQFTCEIDSGHESFIRKSRYERYMEPHHLIPLSQHKNFEVSLDVEENIVSLCSNCHNQLHYGRDYEVLLRKLYNERKELLASAGILVTFEELVDMYQ